MRSLKSILAIVMGVGLYATSAYAYYNPQQRPVNPNQQQINFREACTEAGGQVDMAVNNVRARLLVGGDVWWDGSGTGKYVVPKVEPGQLEVSSIFAGAVWLGGYEAGTNNTVLKTACQTYGNSGSDFWAGPLRADEGTTDKVICDNWDRFFTVTADDIKRSRELYNASQAGELEYTEDLIPQALKEWPGDNSLYFFDALGFDLPDVEFGYNNFYDRAEDGVYDPLDGDIPAIIIRGCEEDDEGNRLEPQFPDEMTYWIYNDEGGGQTHGETMGQAIRMEVQVQAFAYATNDQINDMTFLRYRLNNRAVTDIDSMFFAMWVDADLGCFRDDFIGCDLERSMAYTYNSDAVDGHPACTSVGTYGSEVPIIGTDYFRGPLDENREEIGMTRFMYFNNPSQGGPPGGTQDPQQAGEFYNYLNSIWRDGTELTIGGEGYEPGGTGEVTKFAFLSEPNDDSADAWSMCNPNPLTQLADYDRRTIQASGPFTLRRGAVNELIIGAVWVPNITYPCPDISRLQNADDIAQDLFDNCFDIVDGPDAPDVDWIELDQELVAVFTNSTTSNNFNEQYEEVGIGFPSGVDSTYKFQGYLLYQVANSQVGTAELSDPDKARLIYQVDLEDGISTLYNWVAIDNPNAINPEDKIFFPEEKIAGLDQGIRHTFRVTEDQFANGDRRLLNHRKYYFYALAYATNNYQPFNPDNGEGQAVTYLEGRGNILRYSPIPRPIVDRKLNADYGEGPIVTRLDGVGVGGNFVDISAETKASILDGSFDGAIVYEQGRSPIDIEVFNPLEVINGDYELTFVDENMVNAMLDDKVSWQLTALSDGNTVLSDVTIDRLNEQIFGEYGFTVTIAQTSDVGDWTDPSDGGIGATSAYSDGGKPFWFSGIPDGFSVPEFGFASGIFDYVVHKESWGERDHEVLATLGDGFFVPYQICDIDQVVGVPFFKATPAWRNYGGGQGQLVQDTEDRINDLNNVDIVFTSDKSLWSRCVIIETMPPDYEMTNGITLPIGGEVNNYTQEGEPILIANEFADGAGFLSTADGDFGPEGGMIAFDLRAHRSVSKEAGADGLPVEENLLEKDFLGESEGDESDPLIGMGWFPGYVIDVETGKRKNIFFGENTAFRESTGYLNTYNEGPNGNDMTFNPSSQVLLNPSADINPGNSLLPYYLGGHHFIYVTNEDYDECKAIYPRLHPRESGLKKVQALRKVTWTGIPVLASGNRLLSYADGLIPNELTYKLRVDNPYEVEVGTDEYKGYPTYRFSFDGVQHETLDDAGIQTALDAINVVPNPYYAYSDYEDSRLSTVVKITNLPAKCTVTIYSLDGKFIRQYNRDEQPGRAIGDAVPSAQILPDLEWDLKNHRRIPIAAGVYLIHVDAPEFGERTLKWFGINRKFDPSGL